MIINHFILCGEVAVFLKDINTSHETKQIISEPEFIKIPAYVEHLFIAYDIQSLQNLMTNHMKK